LAQTVAPPDGVLIGKGGFLGHNPAQRHGRRRHRGQDMTKDYRIAALWIGGDLSYLEQLCLKSFIDAGHALTLFSYEQIGNAPQGVDHADARDILPEMAVLRHGRTGSPALHSDLFRYHLLAGCERTIWADTDAYCVRKFATETGHFFAWESEEGVNGGVLGLPRDSEALGQLLEFTSDEYAIPEWYGDAYRQELEAKAAAGIPVHAGEMPWGVWGPHALTHFLKKTGEIKYALPRAALYPFEYKDRRLMLRPGLDEADYVTDETYSIHFYGRRMRSRILATTDTGVPRPRSLVGRLLRKHGIDPSLAPLRGATGDDGDDGDEA
jgi:hypothetical protein